mgnify:CR=1 FL=1
MQDRTYSDLLFLIQSLIGGGNLTTEEQGSIDSFINRRAHEAFETSQTWPRFLITSEERRIIGLTIENATGTGASDINGDYYILGTQKSGGASHAKVGSTVYFKTTASDDGSVIDSGAAIFEQQSGTNLWTINTGAQADRSSDGSINVTNAGTVRYTEDNTIDHTSAPYEVTVWGTSNSATGRPTVLQKQAIPYAENNRNNIGEFLKIYRKKAFINDSSLEYDFLVDSNGGNILNIANTTDNTAFVTYKKELPQYTITSTDIPGEWFFFIAHGAYADFLRMEGRVEQSITEEGVAQGYLAQELEKVDNMSNNNVFRRFSTHGTRQSR